MSKSRFTLATLPLALTLAACSGGGGGGDSSSDDNDNDDVVVSGTPAATVQVERVSLTGLAIKGIARGAKIELFPFDSVSGTFSSSAIASGSTDAFGRYQFDFSDDTLPSGVVKIELSYQDGAELQCDNTGADDDSAACYASGGNYALGEFYPMPVNFSLISIADFDASVIDDSGARVVNITALSSLASALLEADTDSELSNSDKVVKAVAQIKAILGLPADTDIAGDTPDNLVDESDDGDITYGALNAAFVRIAADTNKTVAEVISNFTAAITSTGEVGQIIWKSSDTGDSNTLQVLIDAAADMGTSADFSAIQGEITAADPDVYTNKVPPVVTIGSNLTVAPGDSVSLTATAVQGVTSNTSYQWQTDAPGVTLETATSSQTSFIAPLAEGNYRVGVKATEGALQSLTAITLSVKAPTIVGSELDGEYYSTYNSRTLEYTPTAGNMLLGADTEDGSVLNIATGSEGTIIYDATDSPALGYWFSSDLTFPQNGIYNELESFTDEGFEAKLAVKLNGFTTLDVPEEAEVDSENNVYAIDRALTLRFIPVSKDHSLLVGFGMEDSDEYALVNGQPDLTNLVNTTRDGASVMLARKSTLSGTNVIKDAAYNGFELEFGIGEYGSIEPRLFDMNLAFDSTGALTVSETFFTDLNGQVPTGTFVLYGITGEGPDDPFDYNFNNGRIVIESDASLDQDGQHSILMAATDLSSLIVQSVFWGNLNGAADFVDNTNASWRSSNMGFYIKEPGSPVNLDGKSFAILTQGYFSNTNSVANESSFGIRVEHGTATFSGSTLTLTLSGKQVAAIPDSSGGLTISKPASATRTVEIPVDGSLTTAANGCTTIVTSANGNGTYLCTDGTTLAMRHYSTKPNGDINTLYMGLMVGTLLN